VCDYVCVIMCVCVCVRWQVVGASSNDNNDRDRFYSCHQRNNAVIAFETLLARKNSLCLPFVSAGMVGLFLCASGRIHICAVLCARLHIIQICAILCDRTQILGCKRNCIL